MKRAQAQTMARDADELARARLEADLHALTAMPYGQRVFAWLIYSVCRLEDASWDPHGSVMNLNEGRRLVGRDLVNELRRLDLFRGVYEARFQQLAQEATQQLADQGATDDA